MPRKQHTYHYIYKTTCKVTEKFYIGMHSTSNLEDGYIGSGKRLWNSINKWGRENHEFEILEYLPNRSSLKEREREIVNEGLLQDPMCMNLKIGGEGGFCNEEHKRKWVKAGSLAGRITLNKKYTNSEWIKNKSDKFIETIKNLSDEKRQSMMSGWNNRKGKLHKQETKDKIGKTNSISQKGERNSQFGKMWITDGINNNRIDKNSMIPEGWKKGRKIK